MTAVLFACVHNAGRSQMAAAWFNRLADPAKARAVSAGTSPGPHVHPEVLQVMREVGIDLSTVRPQCLSTDLAAGVSWLITMGCGDECPVMPGVRRADWPLEDPKGKPLERVREIRDEIRARVVAFTEEMGWRRSDESDATQAVRIRPATTADWEAVTGLLQTAELPLGGLTEQYPAAYFVAVDRQDLVLRPRDPGRSPVRCNAGCYVAGARDTESIPSLRLLACDVASNGIIDHGHAGGGLVGLVGLERYGSDGLLRSLAVRPDTRGRGIGAALTRHAQSIARAQSLAGVYLLTSTAGTFFPRHGFASVERNNVPAAIRVAPEFATICPASALCFHWDCGRSAGA